MTLQKRLDDTGGNKEKQQTKGNMKSTEGKMILGKTAQEGREINDVFVVRKVLYSMLHNWLEGGGGESRRGKMMKRTTIIRK